MSHVLRVRRTLPSVQTRRKGSTHVTPRAPLIDINGLGRLRTAHVLALTGLSHSTLYVRMKANQFPKSDGKDGKMVYWNTHTIRKYLQST